VTGGQAGIRNRWGHEDEEEEEEGAAGVRCSGGEVLEVAATGN